MDRKRWFAAWFCVIGTLLGMGAVLLIVSIEAHLVNKQLGENLAFVGGWLGGLGAIMSVFACAMILLTDHYRIKKEEDIKKGEK